MISQILRGIGFYGLSQLIQTVVAGRWVTRCGMRGKAGYNTMNLR
jgi:hypothetical protein